MATKYTLLADRYLHTNVNDSGRVTEKRRYVKGDTIEDLDPAKADRLLAAGAIVEVGADEEDFEDEAVVQTTATDATLSGAVAGVPAGETADTVGTGDSDEEQEQRTASTAPTSRDYESMEYSDLQTEAKERTGNGGGSKADLVERLQAHDRAQASTES